MDRVFTNIMKMNGTWADMKKETNDSSEVPHQGLLVLTGLILPFIFSATRENACSLAVLAILG